MKRKWSRLLLGSLVITLLLGGPLAYSRHRQSLYRNFRVVEEGKLYRSGQMSVEALQRTIKEYQIKTVISLRYADAAKSGDRPPDWQEEEFCQANGIRHIRIHPRSWHALSEGEPIPADQPVAEYLQIMDEPSVYPVLIHCFAGKHRTGAFCALYRMEYQHWSNEDAMEELKALGYVTLNEEKDIQKYMDSYLPRWKRSANLTSTPLVKTESGGKMQ